MDQIAEYVLGGVLVLAMLYFLVRAALAYFSPKKRLTREQAEELTRRAT